MRQILFRTFLTALILLQIPLATKAYDFQCDDLYYNIISKVNKTVEVTYIQKIKHTYPTIYYTYEVPDIEGDVKIPMKVYHLVNGIEEEYTVTAIGSHSFYACRGLTSIEIPASVTKIGDGAFRSCSSMTSIEIPASVTSIGEGAFTSCSVLTSIEIPASVTSIGNEAFYNCRALTSIEIPASVTEIPRSMFFGCTRLTSIRIPESVTYIGVDAFYNCSALTSIEVPASVTKIDIEAFYKCSGLTKVILPNSVISVGNKAFSNCANAIIYAFPAPYTQIKGTTGHDYADLILVGGPLFEITNVTPHQESFEFIVKKTMDGKPAPDKYEDLTAVEWGIGFFGNQYYQYPISVH